MYDLPSENPEDPGLPDEYHLWQAEFCSATFRPEAYYPDRLFIASDLNIYYDPDHLNWYKRPDWFAVVDIPRLYDGTDSRLSYVFWQEEVSPIVAIELLSSGTKTEDLGKRKRKGEQPTKWEVYEQILRIPYYIVFDGRKSKKKRPHTETFQVFRLENGNYQRQILSEPKIWISPLNLGLGLWQGFYRGLDREWLRWYDASGNWVLTEGEYERQRAEQERQRAEQERQRAEQERLRAEQEHLRAEQAHLRAEQAHLRAEQAQQAVEQERLRADRLAERLRQAGIDLDGLDL
jgi:Uma2 family endonuclease